MGKIKLLTFAIVSIAVLFVVNSVALGQTVTPDTTTTPTVTSTLTPTPTTSVTSTPAPTRVIPQQAPSTGHGM